jgi:hypothetical protein
MVRALAHAVTGPGQLACGVTRGARAPRPRMDKRARARQRESGPSPAAQASLPVGVKTRLDRRARERVSLHQALTALRAGSGRVGSCGPTISSSFPLLTTDPAPPLPPHPTPLFCFFALLIGLPIGPILGLTMVTQASFCGNSLQNDAIHSVFKQAPTHPSLCVGRAVGDGERGRDAGSRRLLAESKARIAAATWLGRRGSARRGA